RREQRLLDVEEKERGEEHAGRAIEDGTTEQVGDATERRRGDCRAPERPSRGAERPEEKHEQGFRDGEERDAVEAGAAFEPVSEVDEVREQVGVPGEERICPGDGDRLHEVQREEGRRPSIPRSAVPHPTPSSEHEQAAYHQDQNKGGTTRRAVPPSMKRASADQEQQRLPVVPSEHV